MDKKWRGADALWSWYHSVLAISTFKGVVVEGSKHFCFLNHIWNKTEVIKGGGPPPFSPFGKTLITQNLQQARGSGGILIEINSSALISRYFHENQKQKMFYSSHQEYHYRYIATLVHIEMSEIIIGCVLTEAKSWVTVDLHIHYWC